jgi:hypothetical protein
MTSRHGKTDTPEWNSWRAMMRRCYEKSHDAYKYYGDSGIVVCDRWHEFIAFLQDMGLKPTIQHTIERLDITRNYEPGNCRWATKKEQANNRSSNHLITVFGETMNVTEASVRFGIPRNAIYLRISNGMAPELAVTKPLQLKKRKAHYEND